MIIERLSEMPKDKQITYLDGLKDDQGKVVEFDFVMALRAKATFSGVLESLKFAWRQTDYAGLHVTDPNWYEEGGYQIAALEPQLRDQFEEFFRAEELLDDDQILTSICCYSDHPNNRPHLMVEVSGGEHQDWGQFISCLLEENVHPFDFNSNKGMIVALKRLAQQTGRQEMSFEQYWQEHLKKQEKKK